MYFRGNDRENLRGAGCTGIQADPAKIANIREGAKITPRRCLPEARFSSCFIFDSYTLDLALTLALPLATLSG